MKKTFYFFVPIFLVFVIAFCAVTPTVTMSENLSEKVFRLHILANSDSEKDQNLKLKVRDEIIKFSKDFYRNCSSVKDAVNNTEKNLEKIEGIARNTVLLNGYNYSVKAVVTKGFFNTRKYKDFTLPAGKYNSLKIIIGKGKGHNWWCVMFPAVCVSGCTEEFDRYLTDEEKRMITSGGYKVKFKVVEIIERIKKG